MGASAVAQGGAEAASARDRAPSAGELPARPWALCPRSGGRQTTASAR